MRIVSRAVHEHVLDTSRRGQRWHVRDGVLSLTPNRFQTGDFTPRVQHGTRLRPTPSQGPWGWGWPGARWACTLQPGCHYNNTTRYLYLFVVSTRVDSSTKLEHYSAAGLPIHESQAEEQDIPERRRAPPPGHPVEGSWTVNVNWPLNTWPKVSTQFVTTTRKRKLRPARHFLPLDTFYHVRALLLPRAVGRPDCLSQSRPVV
jgi:hypothetical protein